MGLVGRKPVFWGSEKVRFKPAPSAIETSLKFEILLLFLVSLDMTLSNKQITKALIRLSGSPAGV